MRTIRTPQLRNNHPLQFDDKYGVLIAGGKNGVLASYTTGGRLISTARLTSDVDQCSLDPIAQQVACAGGGEIDVVQVTKGGTLRSVAKRNIPQSGGEAHTLAYDLKTGHIWTVWAAPKGDAIQGFIMK